MARKHSTRRSRTMKGGIWPFTSSTDAATPEAPKRTWMQWLKGESADGSAPVVEPSAVEQAAEPSPPPYGGRRRGGRGARKTKRSRSGKRSTRS